ncbi:unnamed protein product [Sphenostylis stenocarpa]|uniref:Uncharacterized protein n=1 Tax=Sphenostylis stenocarpa TaxID=92480 RepID=A0AA86V3K9_9FABA|nr:unnamed protein product [Sphenostylis stenocarpa]
MQKSHPHGHVVEYYRTTFVTACTTENNRTFPKSNFPVANNPNRYIDAITVNDFVKSLSVFLSATTIKGTPALLSGTFIAVLS